jgi:hypothetical protein
MSPLVLDQALSLASVEKQKFSLQIAGKIGYIERPPITILLPVNPNNMNLQFLCF